MNFSVKTKKSKDLLNLFFVLFFLFWTFPIDSTARISKSVRKAARFNVVAPPGANLVWQTSTSVDSNATNPNIWLFESGYLATEWDITITNTGSATSGAISISLPDDAGYFDTLELCSGKSHSKRNKYGYILTCLLKLHLLINFTKHNITYQMIGYMN